MATSTLSEDAMIRISTTAAEDFVHAYHNALDHRRDTIAQHYMPLTHLPTGSTLPRITYNGEVVSEPTAFEARYKDMPKSRTDCQSVNVHVMNPAILPLEPSTRAEEKKNNMSLIVQISGSIKFTDFQEPPRGFSDSLVLVPNKVELGAKGKGRAGEGKSWVIQSQNFRLVT